MSNPEQGMYEVHKRRRRSQLSGALLILAVLSCGEDPIWPLSRDRAESLEKSLQDVEDRLFPSLQQIAPLGALPEAVADLRRALATADQEQVDDLLKAVDVAVATLRSDVRFTRDPDLSVVEINILVIRRNIDP